MKEKPDRKKKKKKKKKTEKANYALQNVIIDFRCMIDEERLDSFMTEVPIKQKPVH